MTTRLTKLQLIRRFADELAEKDVLITHAAILDMLKRERPGRRTYPTEISHALGNIDRDKRARGGSRVEVDGKEFPSIRAAARACGVSMQTVRKRLDRDDLPNWKRL